MSANFKASCEQFTVLETTFRLKDGDGKAIRNAYLNWSLIHMSSMHTISETALITLRCRVIESEAPHPAYENIQEWSFFEDREVKPAYLYKFKNIKLLAKSQYTVIADIS